MVCNMYEYKMESIPTCECIEFPLLTYHWFSCSDSQNALIAVSLHKPIARSIL